MLPSSGHSLVTLYRSTAYLMDAATVAASMTVNRQPARESLFRLMLVGASDVAGDVVLSGTLDGMAVSETVSFAANGNKRSVKPMDTLSTVTTTGLSGGTLAVQSVDEGGSKQPVLYAVATDRPANFGHVLRGDWKAARSGTHDDDEAVVSLDYEPAWTARRGDQLERRATGTRWLVRAARLLPSPDRPMFWELTCAQIEA